MQAIKYVTVDNPHTVENLLKKVLPGVQVKMDAGHVLFSRLGKKFCKKHVKAGKHLSWLGDKPLVHCVSCHLHVTWLDNCLLSCHSRIRPCAYVLP